MLRKRERKDRKENENPVGFKSRLNFSLFRIDKQGIGVWLSQLMNFKFSCKTQNIYDLEKLDCIKFDVDQ